MPSDSPTQKLHRTGFGMFGIEKLARLELWYMWYTKYEYTAILKMYGTRSFRVFFSANHYAYNHYVGYVYVHNDLQEKNQ